MGNFCLLVWLILHSIQEVKPYITILIVQSNLITNQSTCIIYGSKQGLPPNTARGSKIIKFIWTRNSMHPEEKSTRSEFQRFGRPRKILRPIDPYRFCYQSQRLWKKQFLPFMPRTRMASGQVTPLPRRIQDIQPNQL